MVDHRDQHRGGPNRLFARDDLQHAIGALIAARRNDVGIDQARRNVEAQPRTAPIEKLRRADRSRVRLQHRLVQSASLTCSASAIAKNSPAGCDPEHRTTIDHPLLAHVNQIVVERAGDLGPQVGADMQIGRQPAVGGRLEPQPVGGIAGHPVVDIGAEPQQPASIVALLEHLDRQKRRIVDADADLLHRRHEKVLAVLALENRRKQPDQRRPPDRRPHVEPRTIAGDSHVEIAAERRIPQMHRGQPLAGGAGIRSVPGGSRQSFEALDWWSALASPLFALSLTASIWHDWCKCSDVRPGRVPPVKSRIKSPHRDAVHTPKCR